MVPFKELQEKILWRFKNQAHAYALKALDFRHVLRSGQMIRVETYADWGIYNDIFVDQEYDEPITATLNRKQAGDRMVIIDLGANVGFFTLRVGDLVHRLAPQDLRLELMLVEGSPSVCAKLSERMAEQSHLRAKPRIINGLVGERSGKGTIYEIACHSMNSTVPRRFSRTVQVDFVNLDELCQQFRTIDLIKCDIEGAEETFLRNYPELLRKTNAIVLEFHHKTINYEACLEQLRSAGLKQQEILMKRDVISTEFFWRQ